MSETTLTANVGSGGGGVVASITLPSNGSISFDWNMVVNSSGQYGDAIRYVINGTSFDLSTAGSASGIETMFFNSKLGDQHNLQATTLPLTTLVTQQTNLKRL